MKKKNIYPRTGIIYIAQFIELGNPKVSGHIGNELCMYNVHMCKINTNKRTNSKPKQCYNTLS